MPLKIWSFDQSRQQKSVHFLKKFLPPSRDGFYVCLSRLLEMERPYEYMLPTLKALLDKDRRRLFLKDSRIIPYLGEVKPDEIPFMEYGEYPAIEALTFAVHEITYWRPPEPRRRNLCRRRFM